MKKSKSEKMSGVIVYVEFYDGSIAQVFRAVRAIKKKEDFSNYPSKKKLLSPSCVGAHSYLARRLIYALVYEDWIV